MKKYITIIIVTFLTSCGLKNDHSNHDHREDIVKQKSIHKESKDNNHKEVKISLKKEQLASVEIKVGKLEKKKIRRRIEVTGTIEAPPQNKATIYAPMEAFVYQTDLLPGDEVKKGQTVAILQHPNFIKLQYSYLEAVNNRNVAKADYERKKLLLEKDITSKKSYLASEGTYKSLQNLVDSYASQLKMASITPRTVIERGIQEYIHIKSPIEGYVVENNLNKGKFLAANSEMMEIIDNDHIHAELNVFGTDIAKIKKGDDFVFKPSGVDIEYDGYIKLISQKVNESTKTVNVHGHFEDPEHKLKSGMFINAEIFLEGNEVYAVPEEAIISNDGTNFVFVTNKELEFEPMEVVLGKADNGFVEIVSIKDSNFTKQIVTKGAHFLKGRLLQMIGGMDGHAH
ncbi:efflux RND transporter periplasmic adaptor subunit [Tenacibaculum sp. 190524A02b]|uniref:efflux RND transporter periplasmic adaptor subunit n=1 Tax=Tenacibaculum vairaonense TaxID=3137860 RepID=UPI0031FB0128